MTCPSLWDQFVQVFPGRPKFTEKDVPDLQGKVFIVTGANTGLGKLLSQLLYAKNAKVYMTARSSEKGLSAMASIQETVALNPGNLQSDLWRWQGRIVGWLFKTFMLHPVINGVYTELFAGLSPEVTLEKSGAWIGPWARFFPSREDIALASKPESEGGNGRAKEFADWCEEQIRPFVT